MLMWANHDRVNNVGKSRPVYNHSDLVTFPTVPINMEIVKSMFAFSLNCLYQIYNSSTTLVPDRWLANIDKGGAWGFTIGTISIVICPGWNTWLNFLTDQSNWVKLWEFLPLAVITCCECLATATTRTLSPRTECLPKGRVIPKRLQRVTPDHKIGIYHGTSSWTVQGQLG